MSTQRRAEQGSVLLIAMIALTALLSIGGLTILSVQSGTASAGTDRFRAMALYAAESGCAIATQVMRNASDWSQWVSSGNSNVQTPTAFYGNEADYEDTGNPFYRPDDSDHRYQVRYRVRVLNNPDDLGFNDPEGTDQDSRVTLECEGWGPNNAYVKLAVEIKRGDVVTSGTVPCDDYGQEGQNARGSGYEACFEAVNAADTGTFRPSAAPL